MKAVILDKDQFSDSLQLVLTQIPIPLPVKGEILIRVQCTAVNRGDLVDDLGVLVKRFNPGSAIGLEVCGTIADIGEGCQRGLKMGDQVVAHTLEGSYSEFVAVDERLVLRVDFSRVPSTTLAAVPFTYMAAYHIAIEVSNPQYGDIVLIHAGGSTVGLAMIQLLKRRGVAVVATVRRAEKKRVCEEYGANLVINLSETNGKFAKAILDHFHQGVNIVLDSVGACYISENFLSMDKGGKIIYHGSMGGGEVNDTLFIQKMIESDFTITTTQFKNQSIKYKGYIARKIEEELSHMKDIADEKIKVPIHAVMNLEDFVAAHEIIRNNDNIGKIILLVTSTSTALEDLQRELLCIQARHLPITRK